MRNVLAESANLLLLGCFSKKKIGHFYNLEEGRAKGRRSHRKKRDPNFYTILMFSSFPTTRHSVTLEAKDVNGGGKDTRGTDFKAYGCYSWKESFYYLGKKDEDEDEDESPGRRVSNTK